MTALARTGYLWKVVFTSGLVIAFAASRAQGQLVTLTGTVVDSASGTPLDNVMVYIPNGTRSTTDRAGRFRIVRFDPRRDALAIRRIGYAPRALQVRPPGNEKEIDLGAVPLVVLPTQLDSITVTATRDPRMDDFNRRRAAARGHFFTAEEVWRRNPVLTTDLLRNIAGLTMDCLDGPCRPVSARPRRLNVAKGPEMFCPLRLIVDGNETSVDLDEIPPAWIAGMEVYIGAAQTPPEFKARDCGAVVITTRR